MKAMWQGWDSNVTPAVRYITDYAMESNFHLPEKEKKIEDLVDGRMQRDTKG